MRSKNKPPRTIEFESERLEGEMFKNALERFTCGKCGHLKMKTNSGGICVNPECDNGLVTPGRYPKSLEARFNALCLDVPEATRTEILLDRDAWEHAWSLKATLRRRKKMVEKLVDVFEMIQPPEFKVIENPEELNIDELRRGDFYALDSTRGPGYRLVVLRKLIRIH